MRAPQTFGFTPEQARRIERALLSVNHDADTAQAIRDFSGAIGEFLESNCGLGEETQLMCDAATIAASASRLSLETQLPSHEGDYAEIFKRAARVQLDDNALGSDVKQRLSEISAIWVPVEDLCSAMEVVERDAARKIWKSKDEADILLCDLFTRCAEIWHNATDRWPELMSLQGPEQDWPSGYCRRLGKQLGNPFSLLLEDTGLLAEGFFNGLDDAGLDYMLRRGCRRARREAKEA